MNKTYSYPTVFQSTRASAPFYKKIYKGIQKNIYPPLIDLQSQTHIHFPVRTFPDNLGFQKIGIIKLLSVLAIKVFEGFLDVLKKLESPIYVTRWNYGLEASDQQRITLPYSPLQATCYHPALPDAEIMAGPRDSPPIRLVWIISAQQVEEFTALHNGKLNRSNHGKLTGRILVH